MQKNYASRQAASTQQLPIDNLRPMITNLQPHSTLNGLLQTMQNLWQAMPVKLDYEQVQIVFPYGSSFSYSLQPIEQWLATNLMSASLQVAGCIAAQGSHFTLVNLNMDYFTGTLQPQELITETDIIHQSGNLVRCQCHLYGESNRLLGRGLSVFSLDNDSSQQN